MVQQFNHQANPATRLKQRRRSAVHYATLHYNNLPIRVPTAKMCILSFFKNLFQLE
jgi:hypothetical protein